MAATLENNAKNGLLNAMLRATASATYTVGQFLLANAGGTTVYKYKTLGGSGSEFLDPTTGEARLAADLATSNIGDGTIASGALMDTSGSNAVVTPYTMSVGLVGDGKDISVDSLVVSGGSAVNIKNGTIGIFPSQGSVFFNLALRNRLLKFLIRKDTSVFSAAGAVKVYSGAAPANADDAATGTLLVSFTTSNTSWNAASGGASALAATISATGAATGTAGYVRFEWGSYVIQGSVGTAAADFIISSTSIVSGNSFDLTAATLTF